MGREHRIWLYLCLLMSGIWFALKAGLFYDFHYSSDLLAFTQMSTGFLKGMPVLYNTWDSYATGIHNYYLPLLAAPLSYFFGSYGLFLFYLAVNAGVFWLVVRGDELPSSLKFVFFLMLYGPFGFWIFDDAVYGFHIELMMLPLSVLFAFVLKRGSFAAQVLVGLALCLTREDGPVLAFAISGLFIVADPQFVGRRLRLIVQKGLIWGVVFVVGMAWLKYQAHLHAGQQIDASERVSIAIANLAQIPSNVELRDLAVGMLKRFALLGLTLIGFAFVWMSPRSFVKMLGALLLFGAPVFFIQVLSSFRVPEWYGSMSWPPRFAFLFGLAAAAMLFFANDRKSLAESFLGRHYLGGILILCLWPVAQGLALNRAREYSLGERISDSVNGYRGARRNAWFSADEWKVLDCLKSRLSESSYVIAGEPFLSLFHRQIPAWPTRPEGILGGVQAAELIVCPGAGKNAPYSRGCVELMTRTDLDVFTRTELENIVVYAKPNLVSCTKNM